MHMLLIAYDVKSPKEEFFEALRTSGSWWHYANAWIVQTAKTPQEMTDLLRTHTAQGDHIFVVEIKKNYQGWLPKKAWEWLNEKQF